jgi:hypothetical protein
MHCTIYNTSTGESRDVEQAQGENIVRSSMGKFSFMKPLPLNWDREKPRFRVEVDLKPSAYARHRTEPPFASVSDSFLWQYAERPVRAGEVLELTAWPHASMTPLNESAKAVLRFFTSMQKSRLPLSPWHEGRLRLDAGLSGAQPDLRPRLPTSDLSPRRANVSARR